MPNTLPAVRQLACAKCKEEVEAEEAEAEEAEEVEAEEAEALISQTPVQRFKRQLIMNIWISFQQFEYWEILGDMPLAQGAHVELCRGLLPSQRIQPLSTSN